MILNKNFEIVSGFFKSQFIIHECALSSGCTYNMMITIAILL